MHESVATRFTVRPVRMREWPAQVIEAGAWRGGNAFVGPAGNNKTGERCSARSLASVYPSIH
jgi:hypothetical protein